MSKDQPFYDVLPKEKTPRLVGALGYLLLGVMCAIIWLFASLVGDFLTTWAAAVVSIGAIVLMFVRLCQALFRR